MNLKKKIAVLAAGLVLGTGIGAFAAGFDLSFGGGVSLGYSWSKSGTDPANIMFPNPVGGPPYVLPAEMSYAYKTNSFDSGAFVFADCTYAELSVGYMFQTGKVTDIKADINVPGAPGMPMSEPDKDYLSHLIYLDLLGKYPFTLSEKVIVFPAVGIGVKFPVGGNDFSDKTHDISWGLNLKAGGGVDFALTDTIFLRGEFLYYFQLASDKDAKIEVIGTKTDFHFTNAGYYMGPQVKFAVGYKLKKS